MKEIDQMTVLEKRIEMLRLLQACKEPCEKPGQVVLRALRLLEAGRASR